MAVSLVSNYCFLIGNRLFQKGLMVCFHASFLGVSRCFQGGSGVFQLYFQGSV